MMIFPIVIFCLGLIIGSFLNVVILRYGTGFPISTGRSKCFSCGKTLSWFELIPFLSFIFLRGRCSDCNTKISWQYLLVELLTASLFLFSYSVSDFSSVFGTVNFIFLLAIFSILIIVVVYDFRHQIIPDLFSYLFAGFSLLRIFFGFSASSLEFSYFVAGPILALLFVILRFVASFLMKQEAMGLGDAKLALGIGWFLGLSSGIASVIVAFWTGAIVSLLVLAWQRFYGVNNKLGMKSAVPFGPFLIFATILCFFLSVDMTTLSVTLSSVLLF